MDMTLAALISAGVDMAAIEVGLASLGLPLQLKAEPTTRGSFAALAVTIEFRREKFKTFPLRCRR